MLNFFNKVWKNNEDCMEFRWLNNVHKWNDKNCNDEQYVICRNETISTLPKRIEILPTSSTLVNTTTLVPVTCPVIQCSDNQCPVMTCPVKSDDYCSDLNC